MMCTFLFYWWEKRRETNSQCSWHVMSRKWRSNNQAPPINDNPQTTKENKPTQEHLRSPPRGAHHHQCSCIIFQFHLIANFSLVTNVTSRTPWLIKVSYESFFLDWVSWCPWAPYPMKLSNTQSIHRHMWYLTLEVYHCSWLKCLVISLNPNTPQGNTCHSSL